MSDDFDGEEYEIEALPKPDEVLALHSITADLFDLLRSWFVIPDKIVLDLTEVDSAVLELGEPNMIAAMAMRKLQALNLIATPGVLTATDVVVSLVNDLNRALIQAPSMYLSQKADSVDWDNAFATLEDLEDNSTDGPQSSTDTDPEIDRFEELHALLHDALISIVEASDGEIRYFS